MTVSCSNRMEVEIKKEKKNSNSRRDSLLSKITSTWFKMRKKTTMALPLALILRDSSRARGRAHWRMMLLSTFRMSSTLMRIWKLWAATQLYRRGPTRKIRSTKKRCWMAKMQGVSLKLCSNSSREQAWRNTTRLTRSPDWLTRSTSRWSRRIRTWV